MIRGIHRKFSRTIHSNQPSRTRELKNGKIIDYDVGYTYLDDPIIAAFVRKRFLGKDEVWPKIYAVEGVRSLGILEQLQTLHPAAGLLESGEMEELKASQRFDSAFVFSVFFEPHQKEMLEEMAKKIDLCGLDNQDRTAAG